MKKTYWYFDITINGVKDLKGVVENEKSTFFPLMKIEDMVRDVRPHEPIYIKYNILFEISKEDFNKYYANETAFNNNNKGG
jgi:hypothetical protein